MSNSFQQKLSECELATLAWDFLTLVALALEQKHYFSIITSSHFLFRVSHLDLLALDRGTSFCGGKVQSGHLSFAPVHIIEVDGQTAASIPF